MPLLPSLPPFFPQLRSPPIRASLSALDPAPSPTRPCAPQAKEESIAAIFEAAQIKSDGKAKRVVVTGCLAQRYGGELATELPEARRAARAASRPAPRPLRL